MIDEKGRFIKGYHSSPETEFKKGQHWRNKKPHWDKDWLYNEYISKGASIPQLAKLCNCTNGNMVYWINKHGIQFRSIKETLKIHPPKGLKGDKNGMFGIKGKDNPHW